MSDEEDAVPEAQELKHRHLAIDQALSDALSIIDTVTLPTPAPWLPAANAVRLRPSEVRELEIKNFYNPPPPWGLTVTLSSMYIGPERAWTLAHHMINNQTVTTLDLSMCDLRDEGAVEVFRCLERNHFLLHLALNGNFLGASTGSAAASFLRGKNCRLETLHLSSNCLGDEGILNIASALKSTNRSLKFLNVRGNRMTSLGAYRLLEALEPLIARSLPDSVLDVVRVREEEHLQEMAREAEKKASSESAMPKKVSGVADEKLSFAANPNQTSNVSLFKSMLGSDDGRLQQGHKLSKASFGPSSSNSPSPRGNAQPLSQPIPDFLQTALANPKIGAQQLSTIAEKPPQVVGAIFLVAASDLMKQHPPIPRQIDSRPTPAQIEAELTCSKNGFGETITTKEKKNVILNSLWIQINDVSEVIVDAVTRVLGTRFPTPPDLKKKKRQGKKK